MHSLKNFHKILHFFLSFRKGDQAAVTVTDVVANCHKIFTLDDILTNVLDFSKEHAVKILEILNEIFDDLG